MIKKMLLIVASCALVSASGVAIALPKTSPDTTLGTNGMVRALVQVGNIMWVGGRFTQTSDSQGGLSNIVGIDVTTGQRAASVIEMPQLTGSGSIVYDLSTDGTNVYAAGKFSTANSSPNLVAFDGLTGALTQQFNRAPSLRSVLYDPTGPRVLGGSAKMQAWLPTGEKDSTWQMTTLHTDSTLRTHVTSPSYRHVKPAGPGGGFFAACQCDSLTDTGGATYQTKAIVRLHADGSYDPTWVPGGTDPLRADSGAFGIDLYVDADGVVLAAGGSDFAEKYDLVTGQRIWKNDTNGSSQAVTRYNDAQGSNYFVGGHFRCVTYDGLTQGYFRPRLAPLTLGGVLDPSWVVPITPIYNGVWVVAQDSLNNLWVGGEFKKVGGYWTSSDCASGRPTAKNQVDRTYLARFQAPTV